MISDVLSWLSCPHCATAMIADAGPGSRILCEEGHAFDVARPGYVSLLTGSGGAGTADTAAMVADRVDFLAAGHYAPIADLIAELAREADARVPDDACVVDLGAGTGYYLARVLDSIESAAGSPVPLRASVSPSTSPSTQRATPPKPTPASVPSSPTPGRACRCVGGQRPWCSTSSRRATRGRCGGWCIRPGAPWWWCRSRSTWGS
ncbi:putative RNA methyltransferase [Catenulispora yoronensis]